MSLFERAPKLMGLAMVVFACGGAVAQSPPAKAAAAASTPQAAFNALVGRWVRPDGGYVIAIRSADASGKLEASYANPSPLPFYTAEATRDGSGALKLFFELRAGGYGGSTYRLSYDPAADRLSGVYYQAVARQSYDVVFERAR
jgi:uncharacterized protein (DUF2147 family)